jgi:hypothetical protein
MTDEITRPTNVQINAWTGDRAASDALPAKTPWALAEKLVPSLEPSLAAPHAIDERKWDDPSVGWGVVLPDNPALSKADRSTAVDAPPPIQRLVEKRANAPVLRWSNELGQGYLRRYYPDGSFHDLSSLAPKIGTDKGRIPQYLLIYGTPAQIPWALQYALQMTLFVGRLDLVDAALERYVDALLNDWQDHTSDPKAPVVWSVDHGKGDITWLMARAVAGKVWEKIDSNADLLRRRRIADALATGSNLMTALQELTPSLVVTTSHGMTGPLDDGARLKSWLGAPVDVEHKVIDGEQFKVWQPSGAIWYSHACCSAGSDAVSRYKGLLPETSTIGGVLNGIATAAGATCAPIPRALLGAEKPLRAFVGHVEPTFDWSLRDPNNNQVLTHVLCAALYDKLYEDYRCNPIGWALQKVYKEAGAFYAAWQEAIAGTNQGKPAMRDFALYRQLVAMDRQTLVILGDPTVSLPPVTP